MTSTTTTERQVALRAAATLAAAVGVGRFVFTPILPLMQTQAGVTPQLGATMATANYLGYLVGAVAVILVPALGRNASALRLSTVSVLTSLGAMPLITAPEAWIALRAIAGAGGAIMFVAAAGTVLNEVSTRSRHLAGWAYGGVGAGIALSGAAVLLVAPIGDWRMAWWTATALAAALTTLGRNLVSSRPAQVNVPAQKKIHRPHRWFVPLAIAYFLEGVGYIVAGTFLVAAVTAAAPGPLGKATWIVVGLTAIPSCVLWARLSARMSHPTLLTTALGLQATGIVIAGLDLGAVGAIAAALLFGGTFMGVTALALDAGRHLQISAAVAILSAMYAIGQTIGPVAVAPLLADGFHTALFAAGGVVALSSATTILLRIHYPHPRASLPSAAAPKAEPAPQR